MLEEIIAQELCKVELTADEEILKETLACGIGGSKSCSGWGTCGSNPELI